MASGEQTVAIGSKGTAATGEQSIAIGGDTIASGADSIAIGGDDLDRVANDTPPPWNATGLTNAGFNTSATAIQYHDQTGQWLVDVTGGPATRYIPTEANGAGSVVLGVQSKAVGDLATAIGTGSRAEAFGSTAFGIGSRATQENSVALGAGSTTATNATAVDSATIGTVTYSGFAGDEGVEAGDQVSVGSAGFERQITHVAPGAITADSTDAINGSQLFVVTRDLQDRINQPMTFMGDINSDTGNDGSQQQLGSGFSILSGNLSNGFVGDNLATEVRDNRVLIGMSSTPEFERVTTGDTVMDSNSVTSPNFQTNGNHTVTVSGDTGTINGLTNRTFDPNNYTSGQAATEDQLASVSETASAGWNITANGKDPSNVGPNDTVDFNNRDGNILIRKRHNSLTFDLNPNLRLNSVTTGNTQINSNGLFINGGPSVTRDGLFVNGGPSVTRNGIDAAGRQVTNIAPGTRPGDAVNLSQLEEVDENGARGTATALASAALLQAYTPGSNLMTAGAGTYRGQSALAIGYSAISDNGKWLFKGNASLNKEDVGFAVGVGYQW
ncbi:MAG: hypothetical protein CSA21_05280 [Deltaproteobacteria bacterium]|nr:MAG: hypothetical protein CSA21_05280 [Deltaproteobacteria bacterium]